MPKPKPDPLHLAREAVRDAQAAYEKAKLDYRMTLRNYEAQKEMEPAVKLAALNRITEGGPGYEDGRTEVPPHRRRVEHAHGTARPVR